MTVVIIKTIKIILTGTYKNKAAIVGIAASGYITLQRRYYRENVMKPDHIIKSHYATQVQDYRVMNKLFYPFSYPKLSIKFCPPD